MQTSTHATALELVANGPRWNQATGPASSPPDYQRETIFPGLKLSKMELVRGEGMKVEFAKPDEVFEFAFVLLGQGRATALTHHSSLGEIKVEPGFCLAHYLPNIPAKFELSDREPARLLGIEIELPLLQSLLAQNDNHCTLAKMLTADNLNFFKHEGKMTALQRIAATQLLTCPFVGTAHKLFTQGKVLELLACQMDQMAGTGASDPGTVLRPDDVDRIYAARTLLRENMTEPPSLFELAAKVGMNTNKLKKGFRAVFGHTAFECLREDRMHRAQELLLSRRLNVSEVAWEVGYTNVGHFSVAFRKFFGVRPKDFQAESGKTFHAVP